MVLGKIKNLFSRGKDDSSGTGSRKRSVESISSPDMESSMDRPSPTRSGRNNRDLSLPSKEDVRNIPDTREPAPAREGNRPPSGGRRERASPPPNRESTGPKRPDTRREREPLRRNDERNAGATRDIEGMLQEILRKLDDIDRKLERRPRR